MMGTAPVLRAGGLEADDGDGQAQSFGARTVVVLAILAAASACQSVPYSGWSYIDRSGVTRIEGPFSYAREFSEGLAAVSVGDKWGYIDTNGAWAIPPRFGDAQSFSDGLAVVMSAPSEQYWDAETRFGYIDRSGKFVIPEQFGSAGSFGEGLAPACIERCRGREAASRSVGYIDRTGAFVISPRFNAARPFSEGLAVARDETGKYGYIDRSGEFVLPPSLGLAAPFSDGLAWTSRGYIDRSGRVAIPPRRYADADDFSEGWGAMRIQGVIRGFGDPPQEPPPGTIYFVRTGTPVLRLSSGSSFHQGLAAANDESYQSGYIDKTGKWMIEPQFDRVGYFSEGLAPVCRNCPD